MLGIQACGTCFGEFFAEAIENRSNDEDDFFSDAEEVVIKCATFDDIAGGASEIRAFIDHDYWISRAGANRAFAGFHGGVHDGGAACDGEQVDQRILTQQVNGLDAR